MLSQDCSSFDIEQVPFSCYGADIAFSRIINGPEQFIGHLGLRSLYGLFSDQETYPFILLDEQENWLVPDLQMCAVELEATSGQRFMRMCFHDDQTVHMQANTRLMLAKTELRGFLSDRVMQHENGVWEIAGDDGSIRIRVHKGSIISRSGWSSTGKVCEKIEVLLLPDAAGQLDFCFWYAGLTSIEPAHISYMNDLACRRAEYEEFKRKFTTSLDKYTETMELAAYISWHSVVLPEGYIKHPVMLVSKNIMNMVWGWDYAFNAYALVDKQPELAYAQFLAMTAMQDEFGAYPDAFHARREVRSFVKPPVQGFFLDKMYRLSPPSRDTRELLYKSAAEFTNWWLTYRTSDDGLPRYHHGNESGWDNGTVFKDGLPVKSPDLSTWLILQMDFLAREAEVLELPEDQARWRYISQQLQSALLNLLLTDNGFQAIRVTGSDSWPVQSESLILFLPLLLGDGIPELIRNSLLDKLLADGKYFTPYGFASEPLDSKQFAEDGYWRGAVWPPTALLLSELLIRCGRSEEALRNAQAYCDMCVDSGFFENYSAIDGHGLRDCGFTWSASVFMIFIRDYLERGSGSD